MTENHQSSLAWRTGGPQGSGVDTAACYGNSEELVGLGVDGRRDEFVLSTKNRARSRQR